ncbi:MAG: hypothetical protein AABY22_05270, partial [Nanoarchaeota archaeon]
NRFDAPMHTQQKETFEQQLKASAYTDAMRSLNTWLSKNDVSPSLILPTTEKIFTQFYNFYLAQLENIFSLRIKN